MTYAKPVSQKRSLPAAGPQISAPTRQFAAVALALSVLVIVPVILKMGLGLAPMALAVVVFAVASSVAGRMLHLTYPHPHMGLCNAVTLARLALASALIAPLVAGSGPSWTIFAVAAIALSLDGIDGWLARRQGYTSAFGARFDMEVDSALARVLALSAAVTTGLGLFAVVLGVPRYAFGVARLALPWMRRDLPDRFSRKVACVVQLAALIALQLPVLPAWVALPVAALATAVLGASFASDVVWLWRRRT
jgi:phosphatidylglycerophosphate synthase